MLRFTIRDVLWLTVVVAMGLAWWISWPRKVPPIVWQSRAEAAADLLMHEGWETIWGSDEVNFR